MGSERARDEQRYVRVPSIEAPDLRRVIASVYV